MAGEGRDPLMAVWDSAEQGAQPPHSHPWLAEAIFALDARLRRHQAVLEYTQHPSCIFRLQIDRSRRPLALCDGTHLRPGQGIARLHFWNEHVPPIPKSGAMIGWAHQFQQGIAISLRELVHYLSSRPDLRDVAVICANAPSSKLARIMARYGFEAIAEDERLPIGERIHRFGEDILISLIMYARHARALRLASPRRVRVQIFVSRRALEERLGSAAERYPKLRWRHEYS
jgi:hypothetical protein